MNSDRLAFGTAWVRFLLAACGIWLLPMLYPAIAAHRWVFIAYAGVALLEQFLIWRDIGGAWRPFLGGVLDMAVLTFLVQRVGSSSTMIVALYFVAGVVNSLVVTPRMGVLLAGIGAIMYSGIVAMEVRGIVPFAPDGPLWIQSRAPDALEGVLQAGLLTLLLMFTTSIVALLVSRINQREVELVGANESLAQLSRQDPLTKLWNRRHILSHIEQGLAWLNRGRPMAVVMIDLDQFKRVNDDRGHLEGDRVLQEVAEALRRSTREVDVAGRYGGDEFVVVLPDTNQEEGRVAGNRFVTAIREVGLKFDSDRPVTASAGLSIARPGDDIATVLKRADDFAFAAKGKGGNRLCG
ncbi:MAG: GGDEF domain-containing protein [Polyangiales bacterium]